MSGSQAESALRFVSGSWRLRDNSCTIELRRRLRHRLAGSCGTPSSAALLLCYAHAKLGVQGLNSYWTCAHSPRSDCRELRSGNKIDATELRLEDGLFKSFDEIVRRQLDSVWHTVSYKTKQVIQNIFARLLSVR